MPLVSPLGKGCSPEVDRLATFFDETLGFTPNSVLTMQRRPAMVEAFINLNMAVMANVGCLTSEQKRLIGYLASTAAGCRYCQAHTILAAQRYGATQARLDPIWDYRKSALFTAERAAFAVAAASIPNAVDAHIAAALCEHWDEGEIVEIVGVVALFGFLNRWNDSMATPIEEGAAEIGSRQLASKGWEQGEYRHQPRLMGSRTKRATAGD